MNAVIKQSQKTNKRSIYSCHWVLHRPTTLPSSRITAVTPLLASEMKWLNMCFQFDPWMYAWHVFKQWNKCGQEVITHEFSCPALVLFTDLWLKNFIRLQISIVWVLEWLIRTQSRLYPQGSLCLVLTPPTMQTCDSGWYLVEQRYSIIQCCTWRFVWSDWNLAMILCFLSPSCSHLWFISIPLCPWTNSFCLFFNKQVNHHIPVF